MDMKQDHGFTDRMAKAWALKPCNGLRKTWAEGRETQGRSAREKRGLCRAARRPAPPF